MFLSLSHPPPTTFQHTLISLTCTQASLISHSTKRKKKWRKEEIVETAVAWYTQDTSYGIKGLCPFPWSKSQSLHQICHTQKEGSKHTFWKCGCDTTWNTSTAHISNVVSQFMCNVPLNMEVNSTQRLETLGMAGYIPSGVSPPAFFSNTLFLTSLSLGMPHIISSNPIMTTIAISTLGQVLWNL